MGTTVEIEVDEVTLKELVIDYLRRHLGAEELVEKDISIEVKSKQNYRLQWELANFRARVKKHF